MCFFVEEKPPKSTKTNRNSLSFLKVIPAGLGFEAQGAVCGCSELPVFHLWSCQSVPLLQGKFSLFKSTAAPQAGCSIDNDL